MRVKRSTALFFLMLASMLMLAFTAMPHHHHQERICFNTIHCEHEEPDGHRHPGDNPIHTCPGNLFQAQISRIQSSDHTCCKGSCHHFATVLFIGPDWTALFSFITTGHLFSGTVFREKLHGSAHTSDFSGRAPPFLLG